MGNTQSSFPSAITILPTYTCTAACSDCCFHCSPQVEGRIPVDRLLDYIDQCAEIPSIKLIVFSGGECFLLGKDLTRAVERATKLGLVVRCVTNGYWATSKKAAERRLTPLVSAGLSELNFSTGDNHQAWIPLQRVINGAVVGATSGLKVVIAVERHSNGGFTVQKLVENPEIIELIENPAIKNKLHVLQSPWISSKFELDSKEDEHETGCNSWNKAETGCTSVLTSLVISPAEMLVACCGLTHEQIPEMRLGSLRENKLGDLIHIGRQDFLKIWLMIEGPVKILSWVAKKDPSLRIIHNYCHHCDACRIIYSDQRIRSVIEEHYQEKIPDILLRFSIMNRSRV